MVYLDNAATSWPKPGSVYRTLNDFLQESGGNPGRGGHSLAAAATRAVEDTRLLVSRLINSPDDKRVVFTLNCTDSLNTGLKGLLGPGDHVITSTLEHNSVVRPLSKLEKKGVKVTKSGLQYKIIKQGTGPIPKLENSVTVHYKGTLLNGKEFDSSYDRGKGEPITISLDHVIKGWQEAVTMMPVGSKWEIYVPADLAYGDRANGPDITPNSTLVFDIDLIAIK